MLDIARIFKNFHIFVFGAHFVYQSLNNSRTALIIILYKKGKVRNMTRASGRFGEDFENIRAITFQNLTLAKYILIKYDQIYLPTSFRISKAKNSFYDFRLHILC